MQTGSVDITNLQTKENPSNYTEYFKQEAIISAKNLFSAAVNSLSIQPTLEKIVIMKQIPRYDPAEVDPLSIKSALSQLFNTKLTDLWMDCPQKHKIVIGNHNIECAGAIKESRYREPKTGRFDGIHLLGNSGRKFYTLSVLNILRVTELISSDYNYHRSCAQYQYQARQGGNVYRRAGHGDKRKVQGQQNKSESWNVYRQTRGGAVTKQKSDCHSVPTSNRFEPFSNIN